MSRPLRQLPPLALVALLGGLVYCGVFIARIPSLLAGMFWYPDYPSAVYLGQALVDRGSGSVTLPTQTGLIPMLVQGIVAHLPNGLNLAEYVGLAMALASIVLVVLGSYRIGGVWGAVVCSLVCTCAAPPVLEMYLPAVAHISTVLATVLLALHLRRAITQPVRVRMVLECVGLGVVMGLLLLTDGTLLVVGLLPYWMAVVLATRTTRTRRLVAVLPSALVASALATSFVSNEILGALGIHTVAFLQVTFSIGASTHGIGIAVLALADIAGQAWFTSNFDWWTPIATVAAVCMIVGFAVMVRRLLRTAVPPEATERSRYAWAWYWIISVALLLVAFIVLGLGVNSFSAHYLFPDVFALGALLALSRPPQRERLLLLGALLVLVVRNAVLLATMPATQLGFGLAGMSPSLPSLATFLGVHHLDHGYAGYWDAYGITWETGGQVNVRPLTRDCVAGSSQSLCPWPFTAAGSYTPQSGETFIVLRADAGCALRPPVSVYGAPETTYVLGPYTVLTYGYDIARHFETTTDLTCFP